MAKRTKVKVKYISVGKLHICFYCKTKGNDVEIKKGERCMVLVSGASQAYACFSHEDDLSIVRAEYKKMLENERGKAKKDEKKIFSRSDIVEMSSQEIKDKIRLK